MAFTRRPFPGKVSINLNGNALSTVNEHRHLGLILSSDLRWSAHIDKILSKARRLLNTIIRLRRTLSRKALILYYSFYNTTRIKKSVFYISAIDVSCPEDTLVDYCLSRQVRVASCRFLNSKHFGTKSARLVVSAEDAEATNIVNESFWPENIRARPWKFPENPPDRKDKHPRWLKARLQWLQQLNLQDKTWHPFRLWRLQTPWAMLPQVPPWILPWIP